jgi:uncharacterized protein (TIGR03435 family)
MVRSLLTERFELQIHHQSKPVSGYEMTVASTGLKLSSTRASDFSSVSPTGPGRGNLDKDGFPVVGPGIKSSFSTDGETIRMTFRQATLAFLAGRLNSVISMRAGGSPGSTGPAIVIDKTGVKDLFDFRLEVLAPGGELGINVTNISQALEKQLGLHLTAVKATVDLVVIDHANRVPTPN